MYCNTNFKTKKALKEAVAKRNQWLADIESQYNEGNTLTVEALEEGPSSRHPDLGIHQPGPFGGREPANGWVALEGPHYPAPHSWYARARVEDGVIVKVLS